MKEEFENTKGIIRICISKKNRQHNGQKKIFSVTAWPNESKFGRKHPWKVLYKDY
jgi:hypothetical protein